MTCFAPFLSTQPPGGTKAVPREFSKGLGYLRYQGDARITGAYVFLRGLGSLRSFADRETQVVGDCRLVPRNEAFDR